MLLTRDLATLLLTPMGGTGRPPDFEVVIDGGTAGSYYSRGFEGFLYVGVIFSVPWWPYTAAALIGLVNERADGRAEAVVARLEEAFKRLVDASGERIDVEQLLRSVSIACADGALASNGPAGRAQNNALGVWWRTRRGPDHPRREIIDLFHLVNTSGEKAFKSSSQVLSFFAML